ncbi:MAG TPA: antitoxin Xre/MbcA/ParS toxin-binding domain-containing protein [Anaeromyxobacter sp.]|nr:antitoxin Xre/MbcA/ParS toxin-binding domain-containing protein [Anaeromyxobacter sp.]
MSATEEEIQAAARKVFRTDQGAKAFLNVPCPALGGGTAKELIARGRGAEVLAFLEKLAVQAPAPSGTFADMFRGWLGPFAGRR